MAKTNLLPLLHRIWVILWITITIFSFVGGCALSSINSMTYEPESTIVLTGTSTLQWVPLQPTPTLISTPIQTLVSTQPVNQEGNPVPEEVDDGNTYNGYDWFGEGWVPGLPTFESQFMRMPTVSVGLAEFYSPETMMAQIPYRGLVYDKDKYVGAVAVPFCSEIGHDVWLQRIGKEWEGPFLVVDCARRNDLYGIVTIRHATVEVDFDTAVAWKMARYGGQQNDGRWSYLPTTNPVTVFISMKPPEEFDGEVTELVHYFLDNVTYASQSENTHQVQNYLPPYSNWYGIVTEGLPMWLINGEWITFK